MKKGILSALLALCMVFALLSTGIALAAGEPNITLGSVSISAGRYYYSNAVVSGDNIRTILISFSGSVASGDKIFLPGTPSGFTVSATSSGNDYVKRINLDAGVTGDEVQAYLRGVGFTIAGAAQSVEVSITTENVEYDTFYNIDREHYYQYIPDTSSSWITAYDSARSMTYMGRTGYLATIVSLGEDTFVNSLSGGQVGWLGGTILTNAGGAGDPLYYDGFNTTSVVGTGWYWACGPERGITFYNVNSLYPNANPSNASARDAENTSYYYNWARGTVSYEPNNQTAVWPPSHDDYETCLTTLEISGNTGKHGTAFSWNDRYYDSAGTGEWNAKGYFVEYGNLPIGDDGVGSAAFASDSGTLTSYYTATINTSVDGVLAAAPGAIELWQGGSTIAAATSVGTGVYTASAVDGTYDVYINGEDTGTDITISGAANGAAVDYYTVSFSVSDAGAASGSTISATAGGAAIASGTTILAGKTIVITAAGAGAAIYTYAWSGNGTGGETTAELTIASLSGAVDATCIVTGTALTLSSSVADGRIYNGGRITLTPNIPGGAWSFDEEYLSRDGNMFTAHRTGTTTVIYTLGGQSASYEVTIIVAELPETGQDSALLWALILSAALCGATAVAFFKLPGQRE